MNANALLGFGQARTEEPKREERPKLKDTEGVDFHYYFSQKYQNIHANRGKKSDRGGKGRGRGGKEEAPAREEGKAKEGTFASLKTDEQRLTMMFAFLHKFLDFMYHKGKLDDVPHTFHKAQ